MDGTTKAPTLSSPPKDTEEEKLEKWQSKADKASGQLYLMVDPSQRVHFNGLTDDPVKMWDAIKNIHVQQRAGTRFNAYDDLFNIRKAEDENLQSLINRVDKAVIAIKNLYPTSFNLDNLDDELASMALI